MINMWVYFAEASVQQRWASEDAEWLMIYPDEELGPKER